MYKGRLRYVGKQASGISLFAYKSYKQIILSRSKDYVFTDKDILDEKAIAYYNKFRSMGVQLIVSNVEEVVDTVVTGVDVTPEEVVNEVEEVTVDGVVDLASKLQAMNEDELNSLFHKLGFKSRKKSMAAKVSELLNNYDEDVILSNI